MRFEQYEQVKKFFDDLNKVYENDTQLSSIKEELKKDSPVEAVNKVFNLDNLKNELKQTLQNGSQGQFIAILIRIQLIEAYKRSVGQRVKTIVDYLYEGALRRVVNATEDNNTMDLIDKQVNTLEQFVKENN